MIESALASYGRLVGRRPGLIAGLSLVLYGSLALGWLMVLTHKVVVDPEDTELIWSVSGGSLEQEIKWVRGMEDAEPWVSPVVSVFFQGKGPLEGKDLATRDVFVQVLPLLRKIHALNMITDSGKSYSVYDLCTRGGLPDSPGDPQACERYEANPADIASRNACGPSPIMPCLHYSPHQCFQETLELTHPSYQAIDPAIPLIFPETYLPLPYSSRPSLMNLTDEQIKEEMSKERFRGVRGCPWYLEAYAVAGLHTMTGDIEWNADETLVTKVPFFSYSISLEGIRRAKFRLSLTKPDLANEDEIEEAREKLSDSIKDEVQAFNDASDNLEVVMQPLEFLTQSTEATSKPALGAMIIGGIFTLIFVIVSQASWRFPLLSRAAVATWGICPILLSLITSGGTMLLLGVKFNPAIVMSLPFLGFGLGFDDLFVMLSYFSDLGVHFIIENDSETVLEEVFRRAGPGVALTSACNICGFIVGTMIPVKGMSDFCLGAGIVSAFNFLAMVTLVPCLLLREAWRVKRGDPEYHIATCYCHRRALRKAKESGNELEELTVKDAGYGLAVKKTVENRIGPFLGRPVVQVVMVILSVGLVLISLMGIANKSVGYKPGELFSKDIYGQRAIELLFEYFTFFGARIIFVDVDVPRRQGEMIDLYDQVIKAPWTTPREGPIYLTAFYRYLAAAGQTPTPGVPNSTLADFGYRLYDKYTHPIYAPMGIATEDPDEFYRLMASWNNIPLDDPAKAFLPGGAAYTTADGAGLNIFNHVDGNKSKPLRLSFFRFYQNDLKTDQDYLDSITTLREITDNSNFEGKAFPFGPIFTFWSTFIELEPILFRALLVDLGIIFAITAFLLRSIMAAVVSVLATALIVIQVYGLSMLFLQFNVFVAASLLAGAGISVEFTSHLIAAFCQSSSDEPIAHRLGLALAHAGPALWCGSMSTILSLLPLAWNPVPFVTKYMFGPFAMIVAVGTFNGLCVLPVLLALLGRLDCRQCTKKGPGQKKGINEAANEEQNVNPSPEPEVAAVTSASDASDQGRLDPGKLAQAADNTGAGPLPLSNSMVQIETTVEKNGKVTLYSL